MVVVMTMVMIMLMPMLKMKMMIAVRMLTMTMVVTPAMWRFTVEIVAIKVVILATMRMMVLNASVRSITTAVIAPIHSAVTLTTVV